MGGSVPGLVNELVYVLRPPDQLGKRVPIAHVLALQGLVII